MNSKDGREASSRLLSTNSLEILDVLISARADTISRLKGTPFLRFPLLDKTFQPLFRNQLLKTLSSKETVMSKTWMKIR